MSEDKPQWGEWQEHDGGPCPIPGAKAGDWQLRFRWEPSTIEDADTDADEMRWSHYGASSLGSGDIIAYRVRQS